MQLVLDRPPEAAREVLHRRAGAGSRGRARTAPRPLPWPLRVGRAAATPYARRCASGSGSRCEQRLDGRPRRSARARPGGPGPARPGRRRRPRPRRAGRTAPAVRRRPGERVQRGGRGARARRPGAAATSATRASRRGTSTRRAPLLGGLAARARRTARRRWGSARSPARVSTQSRKSPVDSSPLSSMSQAVPTARARLTGSGSGPASASSTCSDDSSVRTEAKVRSPSLSRCRSATGRSSRYVVVPVVSTSGRRPPARALAVPRVYEPIAQGVPRGSPPSGLEVSSVVPTRLIVSVPGRSSHALVHAVRSRPGGVADRPHQVVQRRVAPGVVGEVAAQPLDEPLLGHEGHQLVQHRLALVVGDRVEVRERVRRRRARRCGSAWLAGPRSCW